LSLSRRQQDPALRAAQVRRSCPYPPFGG
jgi:hypothetical protein